MGIRDLSKERNQEIKYDLLVIEESDPILNEATVSTVLVKEGFKVATYSDHLEALSRMDGLEPALIILGEGLPVDSFEVCSRLRQAVDIPIVILGEVPGDIGWPKAVESGADLYLVKPFRHSELVARVRAILRRNKWNQDEGVNPIRNMGESGDRND